VSRPVDGERPIGRERCFRAPLGVPQPHIEIAEMIEAALPDRLQIEIIPSRLLEHDVVIDLEADGKVEPAADLEDGVGLAAR
jgi:hypothetical protein